MDHPPEHTRLHGGGRQGHGYSHGGPLPSRAMVRKIRLRTVLVLIAFIALALTITSQEVRLRRREAELRAAMKMERAIMEHERTEMRRVLLLHFPGFYCAPDRGFSRDSEGSGISLTP